MRDMHQVTCLLPLPANCPVHVQVYGSKRLVRGLGSGRQGARQGYALALGKLLSDVPALPFSQVLTVMSTELDISGRAKVRLQPMTACNSVCFTTTPYGLSNSAISTAQP